MAISFDAALGVHERAMLLRAQRAEVLANNIANADTPNYKARDIDFKAVLAGEDNKMSMPMAETQPGHVSDFIEPNLAADMLYRTPTQPSVDGNTVDLQQEMARYSDNAVHFQSSFTLLNNKFKGLMSAIKGQ